MLTKLKVIPQYNQKGRILKIVQGTFTKKDYILGYKTSLNKCKKSEKKCKKSELLPSMLSDQTGLN